MKKAILLIILFVFVLFGVAYLLLGIRQTEPQGWFLDYQEAAAVEVIYQQQPYILNFEQQVKLCDLLNESKKVLPKIEQAAVQSEIQSIVIYLFNKQEPIILTPINEAVEFFTVSTWKPMHRLRIHKPHELKQLLDTTHD